MMLSNFAQRCDDLFRKLRDGIGRVMQGRSITEIVISWIKNTVAEFGIMRNKLSDLRKTNYDLGVEHYNRGQLSDAIFRLKLLKRFCPDIPELNYFIGRCYIERNERVKAAQYIEEYLKSNHEAFREEAKYCYDLINKRWERIKSVPLQIIERIFNILAPKYDEIFITTISPSPQDEMFKSINTYLSEAGNPYGNKALDLGCGSGYVVRLLKQNRSLSYACGVDIAEGMVAVSSAAKVDGLPCYDKMVHGGALEYLSQNSETDAKFDIIIISNLVSFLPQVAELLAASVCFLKDNGCIGLSYKLAPENVDVFFEEYFEEFHFSDSIIEKAVSECGLKIKNTTNIKFPDGDLGRNMLLIK